MNTDFRTKQIYRLRLDDYSAASFTSFDKDYFGTMEDIRAFIDAIRNDPKVCEDQKQLIKAFDKYCAGNHKVLYNAAYSEEPLLIRVKRLSAAESEHLNIKWPHINTWRWPYFMKCDKVSSEHIWLSYQGQYVRCIRSRFTKLKYKTEDTHYSRFNRQFWGFPHQIEEEHDELYNRLFVIDNNFETRSEALADIEKFIAKPIPDFCGIINDIFGDG